MLYDVTQSYYKDVFLGESVDDADFPSLYIRAAEIVEEMCRYRLNEVTYLAMSKDVQDRIKKAICAQIEYLDANGGSDVDNVATLQSAALGKYSYTRASGGGSGSGSGFQSPYAPRAMRLLAPTGLLYRGGGCL